MHNPCRVTPSQQSVIGIVENQRYVPVKRVSSGFSRSTFLIQFVLYFCLLCIASLSVLLVCSVNSNASLCGTEGCGHIDQWPRRKKKRKKRISFLPIWDAMHNLFEQSIPFSKALTKVWSVYGCFRVTYSTDAPGCFTIFYYFLLNFCLFVSFGCFRVIFRSHFPGEEKVIFTKPRNFLNHVLWFVADVETRRHRCATRLPTKRTSTSHRIEKDRRYAWLWTLCLYFCTQTSTLRADRRLSFDIGAW